MFSSATSYCTLLPQLGLPKNIEQQLFFSSCCRLAQLCHSWATPVLAVGARQQTAVRFVKHTAKQMCQRVAQQGRWVTQCGLMLTGGVTGPTGRTRKRLQRLSLGWTHCSSVFCIGTYVMFVYISLKHYIPCYTSCLFACTTSKY